VKLKNRVAIVTGGSQGIGRAIALALAREGSRLCLASRSKDKLDFVADEIREIGQPVLTVRTDITREEDVEILARQVMEYFGTVDILVNNAGIAGPTAPIYEVEADSWRSVVDTNLNGLFLCTKYVLPLMIANRSGNILNLGSIGGVYAYPLRTPYNASKWAVAGVTQTIAAEVGPHNIRCNCISPGPVQGERFWNVIKAKADALGKTFEEMKQWWEEQVPLRRFVTEEEVSRTAVFMVSDDSAGITGQQVCVSGGMEVM
jgi:NAD(P)-dependent dehydrogenase (short-subunit alcohol dehydrogenase family)